MSKVGFDRDSVKNLSEKAANEPTRFNATERSNFVKEHVEKITKMLKDRHSLDDIKSVFPEFCEQYPNILEMITRPGGYDQRSLDLMLRLLEKMGQGVKSQHEASIHVGQHLLDSYVKPQLDSTE
jgi:short-subunit dehydrogenase involved in D-alanine esterification of teichoic acids